ncbi:MAG: GNAT family N-acetyltransferase [Deltaproteobacteria bacterium]|nr:GNAT family N-acetyltransferase [Deltaproteobacteria bacterium]
MIIRRMGYEDMEMLTEMGARMHAEGAYGFLPFNREKVSRHIVGYIEDTETQCGLVAEKDNILVGMLGGYITDYFFCDKKVACDMFLFVDRKHRGSSAALRLIQTFRNWAIAHEACEICLSTSTTVNTERTERFYKKMGFTCVGGIFKQRIR